MLAGMRAAVERILAAIANRQRIAIHGDYDVDGITSTVILRRALELLGGDVVQVDGHRPPYVALARRDAARISQQMSRVAGRRIPVVPVVAFLGTGRIVYYGRPPEGCVVTSYRDIGRALDAHGNRIAPHTIEKLVTLAARVDSGTIGQYLDAPT